MIGSSRRSAVVGVDIGGTKIAAALIGRDGTIVERAIIPTPADAVLTATIALISQLDPTPMAIGVAAPGVIDTARGVVRSATAILPGWAGTEIASNLRHAFACQVAVDNDVRTMALGEARIGAGREFPDALYVSIGTGVGGALYHGGHVVRGPHGSAGEIAHLLVPVPPGAESARCGCGRPAHLEAYTCGPAIERAHRTLTGERCLLPEIADRMRAGDTVAKAAVEQAAHLIGRALAGLLASVDASAVIVGGGVAQIGPPLLDPLGAALHDEAIDPFKGTPVLAAQLGLDAPLIGAGLLAQDRAVG